MAKVVADGRVAGMSTLLARHGQVVVRKTVRRQEPGDRRADHTRHHLPPLLHVEADHRRRHDDAVRGRQVAAGRSGHQIRAGVQGAEGHDRRRCRRPPVAPGHAAAADHARADEPYGGIRLRTRRSASGRQALSREGRARRQRPRRHDQAHGGDSLDVPARNELVLLLRRRHPGLHRREAVRPEVRRLSPAADLQAAEDDRHRLLRDRGQGEPARGGVCRQP